MKLKTFTIPIELISNFAENIAELELENEIAGNTEDNEIIINIYYEQDEKMKVFDLTEWVENNLESENK